MKKSQLIDIYKRAKELTEEQYTGAKLSTDGHVKFNYHDRLHYNITNIDYKESGILYEATVIMKSIEREPLKVKYDTELIKGIIRLGLSIDETLDEISYIYPRSLLVYSMQKRDGHLRWAKVKIRATSEIIELGVRDIRQFTEEI